MGYRERRKIPDLGIGVGARPAHDDAIRAAFVPGSQAPEIDWFEIISENFFVQGGATKRRLESLRAARPLVPHGVSLSIGGTDPFDAGYLSSLAPVVEATDPAWFSDHLCFTGVGGRESHDLLPLPHRPDVVTHVVDRIREVQDRIGRPFAVENVSSYLTYRESTMSEWDFLTEIAERADCGILLDVNNVFVSGRNHGFDPATYLDAIPMDRVVQVHIAGHTDKGDYLLDTHSTPMVNEVLDLYRRLIERVGPVSTLLEWDDDLPTFDGLIAETKRVRVARDAALLARGKQ